MQDLEKYTETIIQGIKQNRFQTSEEKQESEDKCPYGCIDGFKLEKDKNGIEIAVECKCRKDKIMKNRLRFANIPNAFKEMTLSNFKSSVYKLQRSKDDITFVSETTRAYLGKLESYKEIGKGLFIWSHTKGSGKTRFAASLANELMQKYEMRVKFATSSNIINEIKATWDRETRTCTQTELITALSTAEVLIIDDFGAEKLSDFVNENFYNIINERYNNRRITIYTSNYELHELPYEDRIRSRVKETTFVIQFPEESVRDYIADRDNEEMIKNLRR